MSADDIAEMRLQNATPNPGWVLSTLWMVVLVAMVLWGPYMAIKFWPFYEPVYVVLNAPDGKKNNESHYARQIARDQLVIGREFQITRDVLLRINRDIVMELPNEVAGIEVGSGSKEVKFNRYFRRELEATTVPYHEGYYKTERDLILPRVPPGQYRIVNVVCYEQNRIAGEKCVDLPDVYVEIKDIK